MERAILLANMNAFFTSVHQALDPRLRGQPVVGTAKSRNTKLRRLTDPGRRDRLPV